MGHRLKDRHQLGDIHVVSTVGSVLTYPAGRRSVRNPPVGVRPVNQAVTFGFEIGIGKYIGKDFARLVQTHGIAVVVGAYHVFHHLVVLLL